MSKLVTNESPLQLLPMLAVEIGMNEAVILQQLHYLLDTAGAGTEAEGKQWMHLTIDEWRQIHFPFWSNATVKRTFTSLQEKGLVISANHNRNKYDRTLWYTIDYAHLSLLQTSIRSKCTNGSAHSESKIDHPLGQNDQMDEAEKSYSLINKDKEDKERGKGERKELPPHPSAPRPDTDLERWKVCHPATHAWLDAELTWPGFSAIGEVIDRLGEQPNGDALTRARVLWTLRGYNTRNMLGIPDWYERLKVDLSWTPDGRTVAPNGTNTNGHHNPAEVAWSVVLEQLRAGQWSLPRDGPETQALNRAGGWAALRGTQEREMDFFKRRFLDAYQGTH